MNKNLCVLALLAACGRKTDYVGGDDNGKTPEPLSVMACPKWTTTSSETHNKAEWPF